MMVKNHETLFGINAIKVPLFGGKIFNFVELNDDDLILMTELRKEVLGGVFYCCETGSVRDSD